MLRDQTYLLHFSFKPVGTMLLMVLFASIALKPAVAGAFDHEEHQISNAHHPGGEPCHEHNDEEPCAEDCHCLCCPGVLNFVEVPATEFAVTPNVELVKLHFSEDILPAGVALQIFRPPQA